MRSILAGLRTLVLPWGAPASAPRIVIGPDVPAAIATLATSYTTQAAILWELSSTQLHFYALAELGGSAAVFRGTYDTTNGVRIFEQWYVDPGADPTVTLGDPQGTPTVAQHTIIQVQGATLLIGDRTGSPPSLAPFEVDGFSAPRGYRHYLSDASSSIVSITTAAETVVKDSGAVTFRDGRAYRLWFRAHFRSTAGQSDIVPRFRQGNSTGGNLLANFGAGPTGMSATNEHPLEGECLVRNGSGADIVSSYTFTLSCPGGTVANPVIVGTTSVGGRLEMSAQDAGSATDFASAINLV